MFGVRVRVRLGLNICVGFRSSGVLWFPHAVQKMFCGLETMCALCACE